MRLRPVRFSLRRMMIAVAVLALVFAAEATRRRWASVSATCRNKAQHYAHRALMVEHMSGLEADLGHDSEKRRFKRIAEHYLALEKKYERAARFPWLPVAPDPPEPKWYEKFKN